MQSQGAYRTPERTNTSATTSYSCAVTLFDYRISPAVTKISFPGFASAFVSHFVSAFVFAFCLLPSAFSAQAQFKSGAELVSIDVLATDAEGAPIADLTAKDFTLKVDGKVRALQSVQLVRLADPNRATAAATPSSAAKAPAPFATNTDPKGRTFVFAIDHDQIHPGNEKPVIDAASRLLDRLAPEDRVAVVTLPRGKIEADLTTDHAAARAALSRVTGHAPRMSSRFDFSIKEALAALARQNGDEELSKNLINEMVDRECHNETLNVCVPALMSDARDYARELTNSARDTVRGLSAFLSGLSALEGTKSIIFVSERLIDMPAVRRELQDLGKAADLARVRTFVIQVNRPLYDIGRRRAPADEPGDLGMEMTGLENVAAVTGGEMFRPSARVDAVMTRIDLSTSAYYLIGFEPSDKERDGKYHRIQVTLNRPNVTLKSRAGFQITARTESTKTTADASPLAGLLRDNIRGYRDLPLRATAFAYRADESDRVKVVVMAETLGTAALESAAFALISESGGQGAEWVADARELAAAPLVTAGAVLPGRYRVRIAASDAIGRQGVVDVPLDAQLTDAAPLQLSTLMAGRITNGAFQPRFDLVTASEVTGFLEIYGVPLLAGAPTATLELAAAADGPALASTDMTIAASAVADRRLARATLPFPAGAPTGDLILRARVFLDGRPVGTVIRTVRR